MFSKYAHTLLFSCPSCKHPLKISVVRDEKKPQAALGQKMTICCLYCDSISDIGRVTATTHAITAFH